MDRFVGNAPKTEIIDGLFFIHCEGGGIVAPISVARKFAERAIRQLDQFDRRAGQNVAPLHVVQGKRRSG